VHTTTGPVLPPHAAGPHRFDERRRQVYIAWRSLGTDLDRALWGLQHGWVIGSAATSIGFLEP